MHRFPVSEANQVVLSAEQIKLLLAALKKMRHDINNHLAVVVASAELARQKPELAEKMLGNLTAKPGAIADSIRIFSAELEKHLSPPTP